MPEPQHSPSSTLVRLALALCVLGAVALTGCCALGAIVSKIEVDLPTGQIDPASPILVKEFHAAPGVRDEDCAIAKAIARTLVSALSAQGYEATYHSPVRETPETLVIDGVVTQYERGSNLVRLLFLHVALLGPADPLAGRAKAIVEVSRPKGTPPILARFQVEGFSGAVGGDEFHLARLLCGGIRKYLNKRLRPDLPVPTAISTPSYFEQ